MNNQISVKIIADSVNPLGERLTTFELEYPRFIHSEIMTHRVFSRNAMSSRAVPIAKLIEQVRNDPAMPIEWGKNKAGMQAGEQVDNVSQAIHEWMNAAESAANSAELLASVGLHKQIVNRVLEPFQRMKTIITSVCWDNFFELRCHEDAQPEIRVLAERMREAMEANEPEELLWGQWHLPYITDEMLEEYGIEDCKKISASCVAQVSYRQLDDSKEKALMIYQRLVESKPIHASPFESVAQATPDNNVSGNFTGTNWTQMRSFIEKENIMEMK